MRYKIHTVPILDAYGTSSECPLCLLEKQLEEKSIANYLGSAVMDPDYRMDVNRYGFCPHHFGRLLHGGNILGVALQAKTRMEALREGLLRPVTAKAAKKEGERLKTAMQDCVICREIDQNMRRYIETVAALFHHEPGFEAILRKTNGHCMRHYAALLAAAPIAGKDAGAFAELLYRIQLNVLISLDSELQQFINQFDAHKRATGAVAQGIAKDIVPRVLQRL